MTDQLEVPVGRALFRFDMNRALPPMTKDGYRRIVEDHRFAPACELQVAMATRGMLTRDGWTIVEGWLAFEPADDADPEWAVLWVGVGTQDEETGTEVLRNILQQIAEQEGGDPEPDLEDW